MKQKYNTITPEQTYTIRALHQKCGWSVKRILDEQKKQLKGVPVSTVYRHAKIPLERIHIDKRIKSKSSGRPSRMTSRDKRKVIRQIHKFRDLDIDFCADDVQAEADVPEMARSSFRRYLNKWGYHYLTNRRKGILSKSDKKQRLKFARQVKKTHGTPERQMDFWKSSINMFADIVGFEYKRNPYEMAVTPKAKSWRRRDESLIVTRKGAKEGVTSARFLVGISFDKGVTMVKPVPPGMKGPLFAYIIRENTFENGLAESRTILQDNDPVQNSAFALRAFSARRINLFKIPPRSPDINVIENLFHSVKKSLAKQAKQSALTRESMVEFKARVQNTLENFNSRMINNLINSLPKRIDAIIKSNGGRIKY
jgi:hypothetical protein